MGIEDAAMAAEYVDTKKVVGMHFDTFPPITIDKDEARQVFKDKGLSLDLPGIGDTISM